MTTTRGVALISIIYTVLGVIGFIPSDAFNAIHHDGVEAHYLLGFLAVNDAHNLIHLAIGQTGLWAARSLGLARLWGRIVGPVLLVLFIVGMAQAMAEGFPKDQILLNLVTFNSPLHILHLVTGGLAFYLGLMPDDRVTGDSVADATR
jgi:hypothetical protein